MRPDYRRVLNADALPADQLFNTQKAISRRLSEIDCNG
jgi:hypothetical protein